MKIAAIWQDSAMGIDLVVRREPETDAWELTDLLGRRAGRIAKAATGQFTIEPEPGNDVMSKVPRAPQTSLDAALDVIQTHTRGMCTFFAEEG